MAFDDGPITSRVRRPRGRLSDRQGRRRGPAGNAPPGRRHHPGPREAGQPNPCQSEGVRRTVAGLVREMGAKTPTKTQAFVAR